MLEACFVVRELEHRLLPDEGRAPSYSGVLSAVQAERFGLVCTEKYTRVGPDGRARPGFKRAGGPFLPGWHVCNIKESKK